MRNKKFIAFGFFVFSVLMPNLTIFAAAKKSPQNNSLNTAALLHKSQISYQADGGFTAVKSYSVIISCIDGKISTLSTISDPKLMGSNASPLRHIGTMDEEAYLNLWDKLNRMAVFEKKNGPEPRADILDEFTVTFQASVGNDENQFSVRGCSRPEASQYFAFQHLLDSAVGMENLWNSHQSLAQK